MFFKGRNRKPINEEDKKLIDKSFSEINEFIEIKDLVKSNSPILPTNAFFDFPYNGRKEDGDKIFIKICSYMEINSNNIHFGYYSERKENLLSSGILMEPEEGDETTLSKYIEYDDGGIEILIEEQALSKPLLLVAILAHEIGQYKLRSEFKYMKEDHILVEILIILYGFGIFTGNQSIFSMKSWSDGGFSTWRIDGGNSYLHYEEFGYALAYYSYLREDFNGNKWSKFLSKVLLKSYKTNYKHYFRK